MRCSSSRTRTPSGYVNPTNHNDDAADFRRKLQRSYANRGVGLWLVAASLVGGAFFVWALASAGG